MGNFISGVTDWTFLDEPMKRWFIFFGAVFLMMFVWGDILSFIR